RTVVFLAPVALLLEFGSEFCTAHPALVFWDSMLTAPPPVVCCPGVHRLGSSLSGIRWLFGCLSTSDHECKRQQQRQSVFPVHSSLLLVRKEGVTVHPTQPT